jgi:hypothetical protein
MIEIDVDKQIPGVSSRAAYPVGADIQRRVRLCFFTMAVPLLPAVFLASQIRKKSFT